MNIPDGILCASTHEYILDCGEYVLVGITDILLSKLGDVIFVEFPEKGSVYTKKKSLLQLKQMVLLQNCICRLPVKY